MKTSRRGFIRCAGAFPLVGMVTSAWAGEKPLLRIGIMTDTHIGETKASCGRVKLACELFRRQNVDMVAHVGDLADYHYPKGYAAYRSVVDEAFEGLAPEARPQELFVYAAHDTFAYGGRQKRSEWPKYIDEAYSDMQRLVRAPNGPYASGSIKGFPYVTFPQTGTKGVDWPRIEKMVADAVTANPGKPVFVFAHVPPAGTTRTGRGNSKETALFSKYPQIVNISGHTHGSLADERAIWQGSFTSMNAGCLQNWGDGRDGIVGNSVKRMNNYGVVVLDVFADCLVFRRFDVRDGEEYRADHPWTVPWPFDSAAAPYRPDVRRARAEVPAFAAGAALKVTPDADGDGVSLSIPATGETRAYVYRVRLDRCGGNGDWHPLARRDFFGDFWQRRQDWAASFEQKFAAAYFAERARYRFRVSPVNCWGVEGEALETAFSAPESCVTHKVVWSSDDPMRDCEFRFGLSGGDLVPKDGDSYRMDARAARLVLPKEIWDGPKGTRFRFVADIRTVQSSWPTWTIVLRNPMPMSNAFGRISTPDGNSGSLRYVVDFAKANSSHAYYLLVREGGVGNIRFDRIRVERWHDVAAGGVSTLIPTHDLQR